MCELNQYVWFFVLAIHFTVKDSVAVEHIIIEDHIKVHHYIIMYTFMWPRLGKPVLSTHKIWPNFESVKRNNFLSVIRIVSKMSSYTYVKIYEELNKTNRCCIVHTEQEIGAIIWISVYCVNKPVFSGPVTYVYNIYLIR